MRKTKFMKEKNPPKKYKLRRSFEIFDVKTSEKAEGVEADDNKISFSFSSEKPVARWFGKEILSHASGCANLERLNSSASLLFNHDWDRFIGRVVKSWIGEDKRGHVEIEFATNADAQEKKKDILGGFLRNVSFGYVVDDLVLSKTNDDGSEREYTATSWEPYEVSFVTVPADFSVGIGRDSRDQVEDEVAEKIDQLVVRADEVFNKNKEIEINILSKGVQVEEKDLVKLERERVKAINHYGDKFKDIGGQELARQLIESGATLDAAKDAFMEKIGYRQVPVHSNVGELDLSKTEKKKYSLIKAITASLDKNWDKAGFELECSRELAKRHGKETQGFFMPMNLPMGGGEERATYAVGAAGTGGNLVETSLLDQSFIEILRAKALVLQMGAFSLSGLIGNVAIPRRATSAAVAWVTEGNAPAQAEGTFDLLQLSPKTVAGFSKITRQMLLQGTPDVEMLARLDLAEQMALAIDLGAITGTGTSGQPLGILNTSGIGSVVGGTNGANILIDHIIDLETAVADANADAGRLAYLANAKTVGSLKKLKGTDGTYLWGGREAGMGMGTPGMINGYPVGRTNQLPKNLTKGTASGVCSAVIFGNWSDLIIGSWGALDIVANPFGTGFAAGTVDLRAMQSVDVGLRQKASFAAMSDALTP